MVLSINKMSLKYDSQMKVVGMDGSIYSFKIVFLAALLEF